MIGGFELGRVHCVDCLEALKQLPDKCVDLVLTDPPYGLGDRLCDGGGKLRNSPFCVLYRNSSKWDIKPSEALFEQIFRVSTNQIICGGNYFGLPPTRGFVVWDKRQPMPTLSSCEYIWTSFDVPAKMFAASSLDLERQHPTQKPVALFRWILEKYSKPSDIILDPFMGSGTTGVAAVQLGRQFLGFEIDPEYCRLSNDRIEAARKGLKLNEYRAGQQTLFQ